MNWKMRGELNDCRHVDSSDRHGRRYRNQPSVFSIADDSDASSDEFGVNDEGSTTSRHREKVRSTSSGENIDRVCKCISHTWISRDFLPHTAYVVWGETVDLFQTTWYNGAVWGPPVGIRQTVHAPMSLGPDQDSFARFARLPWRERICFRSSPSTARQRPQNDQVLCLFKSKEFSHKSINCDAQLIFEKWPIVVA